MFLDRYYKYEDETDPNKGESMTGNKSTTGKGCTFWNWRLYWSLGTDLDIRPEALTLQSLRLRLSEKWAWSFSLCLLWKTRGWKVIIFADQLSFISNKRFIACMENQICRPISHLEISPACQEFYVIFTSLEQGVYMEMWPNNQQQQQNRQVRDFALPSTAKSDIVICWKFVTTLKGQSEKMNATQIGYQMWGFFLQSCRLRLDRGEKLATKNWIRREDVLYKQKFNQGNVLWNIHYHALVIKKKGRKERKKMYVRSILDMDFPISSKL